MILAILLVVFGTPGFFATQGRTLDSFYALPSNLQALDATLRDIGSVIASELICETNPASAKFNAQSLVSARGLRNKTLQPYAGLRRERHF
jgi:hypothetical protein